MFARLLLAMVTVLAAMAGPTRTASARIGPPWSVWSGPDSDLLPRRELPVPGRPCATQDCVVTGEIFGVVDVVERSLLTFNQLGITNPAGRAQIERETSEPNVRREMRRALFSHPARFAAWCARMRRFAAAYPGPDPYGNNRNFVRDLLVIAELIDTRAHRDCLPDMLAAFQVHDPEMLGMANDLCETRAWRNPGCSRIPPPPRILPPGTRAP